LKALLERVALSLVSLIAGAALLLWFVSTHYFGEPRGESEPTATEVIAPVE
jgi:hypothetical protein